MSSMYPLFAAQLSCCSLFSGSYDQKLHCVSTLNGLPLWLYNCSGGSILATPYIYLKDDSVLCADLGGHAIKLHLPPYANNYSAPTVLNNEYTSSHHPVEAWTQNLQYPIFSSPIISSIGETKTVAIIVNVKGTVIILDYDKGGFVLWSHSVGANVFSSPVLMPNHDNKCMSELSVIFGAHDNYLHCIGLTSEDFQTLATTQNEHNTNIQDKIILTTSADSQTLRINTRKLIGRYNIKCYEKWKAKHSAQVYATPYIFVNPKVDRNSESLSTDLRAHRSASVIYDSPNQTDKNIDS